MLFVQFTLDHDRYVLDSSQIERMLPLVPLKTMPGVPAWVAGIFEHEGAPVPVIDLAALALGRRSLERLSTRLALVYYPHKTPAGVEQRRLAIMLERAIRTLSLDATAFSHSGVEAAQARYLGPLARDAQGFVQWVRVEHLLPDHVQAQLFTESAA
ncbi:chemotaxis-related protein [Caballeronia sordidicola]|uniref:Chemotaxis-related protein n=1 Tax=Caballeronia sordidicola TaxID=196367 RepID=A0A158GMW7_CABSO|nr:chemotaxis protein CheW [Caballeronia sordidicola]SAL32959.1 chemotaxis-related protein [Caballeronia sordidicola]